MHAWEESWNVKYQKSLQAKLQFQDGELQVNYFLSSHKLGWKKQSD